MATASAQEFSKRIKQKYPQYKDVDDVTLATKFIEKYPVYKDQVVFEQPSVQAEQPLKIPTLAEKVVSGLKQAPRPPVLQSDFLSMLTGNVFEFQPVEALEKAGQKVSTTLEAVGVPKFIAETGSLTPKNIATQMGQELLMTPVLAGAGAVIKKGAKALHLSESAEKLMANTLRLNPSDKGRIAAGNVAGKAPEKWLLERGITGSPEEIATKLDDISEQSYKTVDKLLSGTKGKYQIRQSNQAIDELKDLYSGTLGNEEKLARISELKEKTAEGLSLPELNEVKRLIDKAEIIFSKSGDVKSGAKAEGLKNIRDKIKTFIEDSAKKEGIPNIKELNKQTQVSTEISKAIEKRIRQSGNNRIISLTDFIAMVGAGGGAMMAGPAGGAMSAGAILVGKKISENPSLRIRVANELMKLSGAELKALEGATKGAATAEARATIGKMLNTIAKQSGIEAAKPKEERIQVPALR